MANRERKKLLTIYVSEEEYKSIQTKMEQYQTENFSQYARKMLIDGMVIKISNLHEIIDLKFEIKKIGVNINQIAKHANETRTIDKETINEIVKKIEELENLIYKKIEVLFNGYN